jgi:hypothetical protein
MEKFNDAIVGAIHLARLEGGGADVRVLKEAQAAWEQINAKCYYEWLAM